MICNTISCNIFGKKEPKNATVAGSFVVWGVKTTWSLSPFFSEGGGAASKPQEDQNLPKTVVFYSVFLFCITAIRWPQHRLSRGPVANFLEPWVLKKCTAPAFLQRFSACKGKHIHFYIVLGPLESNQGLKENLKMLELHAVEYLGVKG